jgi:hypothetical protein
VKNTTPARTLSFRLALAPVLLCATAGLGFGQAATAAERASTGQAVSWATLAKLPDWSGTWALNLQGHEFASTETRLGTLPGGGNIVPFTPQYIALVRKMRDADKPQVSLSRCLPAGIPGVMLHTIGLEWLFTPGRVTMITENGEIRRIHTDGRGHASSDEFAESYEGDSIGHWEGKTLVVDTTSFPNGSLLKDGYLLGTMHTRYVERIFLKDHDHLQIDSEISDPEIYTTPYKATRIYDRVDYPLPEPQCSQTSRTSGTDYDLTPPPPQ